MLVGFFYDALINPKLKLIEGHNNKKRILMDMNLSKMIEIMIESEEND